MSLYGPAPLPAHERRWRHPSEIGQAAWVLTEPPVAIGRGLLVTTGAIGCMLGIAVLWLLVPVGGGLAPIGGTHRDLVVHQHRAPAWSPRPPTTTGAHRPASATRSTTIVDRRWRSRCRPRTSPVNTVLVTRPKAARRPAPLPWRSRTATTPFIVTTANAVADNDGFSMVGTGDPSDGSVMSPSTATSRTCRRTTTSTSSGSPRPASAEVGDMVTVLGQEQTPVQFVDSGAVVELDAAVVREGTPGHRRIGRAGRAVHPGAGCRAVRTWRWCRSARHRRPSPPSTTTADDDGRRHRPPTTTTTAARRRRRPRPRSPRRRPGPASSSARSIPSAIASGHRRHHRQPGRDRRA